MTFVKRLRVLTAVLGVAAATAAVGTTLFGDFRGGPAGPAATSADGRPDGSRVTDELAVTKFSTLPAVTYKVRGGDTLFAWQVKPAVEPAPARPRDVLVLVDTSASQAGKPLQQARQIVTALSGSLTADDRVSVWTVSTPAATRALTKDFQPPAADDVKAAADALTETEYGSGATDLKGGLEKALATLAPNRGRQQLVLFLGDGESAYAPVSEADRVALGGRMDRSEVFFFAVPLGVKVNPHNLHGFAALTGGTVVRVQEDLANPARRGEFVARLKAAFDVPVVKADKHAFGDEVAEVYPTRLPPLRADKPTLVLGKLARPAAKVSLTVTGVVGTRPVSLALGQDLPAPQADHYFLNLMLGQWRDAPLKEAPAVLQADRALALASTQVKLYRDEFLTQATWAVTMDRLDEAAKLYTAALRIDPDDAEASSGAALVEKMKTGRVTKAGLEKRIAAAADALKIDRAGAARTVIQQDAAAQPPADPAAQPPGAAPATPADLLREANALRRVEEQRYRTIVDATIARARQLLRTDPDAAYQDLKRQRDDVLAYRGIGDDTRTRLASDLTAVMQEVFLKGGEIKRQAATEREQLARARYRLNEFDRQLADEDRTKAKIDAFRQLMQHARYELAYQESQVMIQERINRGQAVPEAATASYIIGQQATQLREWRELVRVRQDRFLLAMMQAEKSHIPYPDEPPVHFPPAAVWRELTGLRKERYEDSLLGREASPAQKAVQSVLENTRVSYDKDLTNTPLQEVLADLAAKYKLTFVINKSVFGDMAATLSDAKATKLSVTSLNGLALGTFLDIYLRGLDVANATYMVRPDYIEITTYDARLEEKVTRVFPVADLVVPIANGVNQSSLQQTLGVQQQSLAIFGQASLYGGGLQNAFFGGNNGGGGGGNPFGQPGGGGMGMNNPFFGNQNMMGGIVGLGGNGGLGQFGNLGGQFGLQGGTQEQLLMNLIYETVAKGEWANVPPPPQDPDAEPEVPILQPRQLNTLGYYPPAFALVVRGTSRYHTSGTMKLKGADALVQGPGRNRPGEGFAVIGPGGSKPPAPAANPNPAKDPPAVAAKPPVKAPAPAADTGPLVIGGKPTITDPKLDPVALMKRIDKNPKRMWNQAIDWTINNPGVILASADFLMDFEEYGHAAEVLKANLRKGLATDEWAHEALAIALQMSQASPAEVERAALSAADLDPSSPKAYLKAAKAEAELKNHDLAVAFCKRAAEFGPDQPGAYANALAYAEHARDVKPDTVEWAASNLLRRDWGVSDGVNYHAKTRDLLSKFVTRFEAAGAKADGLKKALVEQTQRDLVVELVWQGAADLDLTVAEPSGSVCSATNTRTSAGGVLKGDILDQKDDPNGNDGGRSEAYTAASAFSGTYRVTVRAAFGRPLDNKATLKVYRFKGTPKETFDLVPVDLSAGKPVEVKLDGGSRTELAVVTPDATELRTDPLSDPVRKGPSGLGGGFGTAGSVLSAPVSGSGGQPQLPVVAQPREQVLSGMGSAADLRASYKLNPDRKTYTVHVNPVFATAGGKDVALPKVPLLPGGEGGR